MGYHIDYNSLDTLYNSIYSQATNWQTALESLSNATTVLAETAEMSGAGADSIRAYMSNVHSTIQALLAQVITLHQYNCLQYKQDYQHNIDTGLYTVIKQSELTSIKSSLSSQKQQACNIEDALSYTLRGIKDIFTVSYNDVTWVNEAHQSAITFLSDLDESIRTLEDSHHSSDFVSTGDLIAKLTAMIEELKGHGRSYKTDFSPEVLAGSETFRNLYASYLNVSKELEEEAEAIETAIENENERIADLQAEYEKRQKEAQAAKWIVTGLCVIGSVVAIAATGGAATPLVVGAISATSSAIIAGTSNLADQYVANGNLNNVDWGSFGSDVAVGAVTGFVTGYVGASVGGAITSGLSKTATGATLLNSSNAVVRIGTGAVIGSVSEVTSGVASRGAVTLITSGGDVEEALDAAFDTKQMAYDAVIGGVTGGIGAAKNPMGKEISVEDIDAELLETKPANSPNPEKWITEKGGKIYVDGNNTWTYQSADGVSVCYSGGYPDFGRAGLVEGSAEVPGGFTDDRQVDFKIAKDSGFVKPDNTTLHHHQNGHTLQAVDTKYHKLFTHKGGFSLANGG